jgi:hypothetical protein
VSCGKRRYLSRGAATKARRQIGDRTLRAYRCGPCECWHLGHLPDVVRRGLKTRGEVYGDEAA